jgi:predicted enzyme related to lactoylglutathione lyase
VVEKSFNTQHLAISEKSVYEPGRSTSLGGTVAVPKMPIQGVGWLAYAKDPDGNIFGLMQPDEKAA